MPFESLSPILQQNLAGRLNWTFFRPAQESIVNAVLGGEEHLWLMGPVGAGRTSGLAVALSEALLRERRVGIQLLYVGSAAGRMREVLEPNELRVRVWGESTPAEQRRCLSDPPEALAVSSGELPRLLTTTELWTRLRYLVVDDAEMLLGTEDGSYLSYLFQSLERKTEDQALRRIAVSTAVGNPDECLLWLCGTPPSEKRVVRLDGAGGSRFLEVEYLPELADKEKMLSVKVRGRRSLVRSESPQQSVRWRRALEERGLRCQGESRDCLVTSSPIVEEHDFQHVVDLRPPESVRGLLVTLSLAQRSPGKRSRVSLTQQEDTDFLAACALLRLAGRRWVEPAPLNTADWPAYLRLLFERILGDMGVSREDALTLGDGCYPSSNLDSRSREEVIDFLLEVGHLQVADRRLVLGSIGEKVFEQGGSHVLTRSGGRLEEFALESHASVGFVPGWFVEAFTALEVLIGGELYGLSEVRRREGALRLTRSERHQHLVWNGPLRLYHRKVAEEIRALLVGSEKLPFLQPRQDSYLSKLREKWRPRLQPGPVSKDRGGKTEWHTFAGGMVNGLLAKWHLLQTGGPVFFNNLTLAVTDKPALMASLDSLVNATESELQDLTRDLPAQPIHELLPSSLLSRYLRERLFGEKEALELARSAAHFFAKKKRQVEVESAPVSEDGGVHGDPFLAQLKRAVREHPTRTKWVLVPSRKLGLLFGERLLLEGADWVNLRFLTPFELALDAAAPHLLEKGLNPRPEGLGPDLVSRLLKELTGAASPYFRPLVDRPRVARTLWEAVQQLRMAGVSSVDLNPICFSNPHKGRELRALYQAYEEHLTEQKWGDRAVVFLQALEHLQELPLVAEDLVFEYPNHPWQPLERRFLDALPGRRQAGWVYPVQATPRRWKLLCGERKVVEQGDQPPASPRFFCAGRRDSEIQEVFRRMLAEAIPLDQAELVLPDQETLFLVWDKLQKYQLPATFEEGLPVGVTTPGKAIAGLVQWAESGFSAFLLREMLVSGLLHPKEVTAAEGARFLERGEVSWGGESYHHQLIRLCERYRAMAQNEDLDAEEVLDLEKKAERVEHFRAWTLMLLGGMPMGEAPYSFPALVEHVHHVVTHFVPARTPLDATAKRVLLRVLRETASTKEEARGFVAFKERFEDLQLLSARPKGGHIHVTSALSLGKSGRSHIFLVGLEAGTLSPDPAQDPILNDEERLALHPGLLLSTDRVEEYRATFDSLLSSLHGTLTMSYSCRDYRTGEELLCSRFFFDNLREQYPQLETYEEISEVLGEPVAFAPDESEKAAGEAEWWLSRLRGRGVEARPIVAESFPWLGRGLRAAEERASALFTRFDGWVPQAARLFDPRHTDKAISVSALQNLAVCPQRAFLETALGLKPIELQLPNLDRWLDARSRGTALHETFAAFHRKLRDLGRRPRNDDKTLLRELLERELLGIRQIFPAPSEAVEKREILQLERELDRFLSLECSSDREVVGCEVGFGLEDPWQEPFARLTPVAIRLSPDLSFYLRGRIDRLDRVGTNLFEVVDYKTGRDLGVRPDARYSKGKLLQHALYALVAQELLKVHLPEARVRGSAYYFPVVKAESDWISFSFPDPDSLKRVLELVLEPVATGSFVHTKDKESACRYCDFRAACEVHEDAFVRAKLECEQNEMLRARKELEKVR